MSNEIKATPFLMFEGQAEEAMNYYKDTFDDTKIVQLTRYGAEADQMEGKVARGLIVLKGQQFMFYDSTIKHNFTFTPALSIFVTCDSVAEIDQVFEKLAEGGQALMPIGSYPFSRRFGWVNDRFGVSWQLNLP